MRYRGFATLDEGLRLFDQISKHKVNVITEGHNAHILRTGFEFFGINNVGIVDDILDRSGTNQLKTLYNFFLKVPHNNKVIFILDCDAKKTDFPFEEKKYDCFFHREKSK